MTKFLMISENCSGGGIARQIIEEGDSAALWIRLDRSYAYLNGLVPKLQEFKFTADKETVIVADCTGFGELCDMLRRAGYKVVGGSAFMDRLENDREFSEGILKECGIEIPKSYSFDDIEEGKEFLKSWSGGKLVLKPDGESSGTVPSTVPKDDPGTDELMDALEDLSRGGLGKTKFLFQEFVYDAVEISLEAWFSGRLLRPLNHTIESKKMMDGDSGATCGCSGNIVFAADNAIEERIADALEKHFPAEEYFGVLDLNLLVTKKKKYCIEFTPRWGYDATPTLFYRLLHGNAGKALADMARGQLKRVPLLEGFASGLRLTLPPYPMPDEHFDPRPLRGITLKELYPYCVSKEDGQLLLVGNELGVALGHGDTIEAAMGKAQKVAEKVPMSRIQYRRDLAEVFQKRYDSFEEVS